MMDPSPLRPQRTVVVVFNSQSSNLNTDSSERKSANSLWQHVHWMKSLSTELIVGKNTSELQQKKS